MGTDIVSVSRIAALIQARGTGFLERWFSPAEIAYCTGKAFPSRHFAARLAAKEAVAKALPGYGEGPLRWRSIEIAPDRRGAPEVTLHGQVAEFADQQGVQDITVSLSHCDEYATGVAIVTIGGDA